MSAHVVVVVVVASALSSSSSSSAAVVAVPLVDELAPDAPCQFTS